MANPVTYAPDRSVANITMDDGKVNALSAEMISGLSEALDQAATDGVVVVLTGRAEIFSAGFDLKVLQAGGPSAGDLLSAGFALAEQMLCFPRPLVIACNGHAIAMASFLLLCADYRIGASGPYRVTANEVAIGLPMPRAAVAICRQRLPAAHFHRAVVLAEVFSPDGAVDAGFLDAVAAPGELREAARHRAELLATLDAAAHTATKLRTRQPALENLRLAVAADAAEWPVQQ